ncbi:MAG: precorrin-2 C(20)-methyltransferase [Planctomycetota bacterium]|nr:precorrin-2 C(20)-methyltransferase [Planctomycetota bacterium]
MTPGTLYGIGIGPGDPDLITVKGASILSRCRHVFVPKARTASESLALSIAGRHVRPAAAVHELVFPMTTDEQELDQRWRESARQVAAVLTNGDDACFLTLGDPFLYSTYIYLMRALRQELPGAPIVTVPGVTAFSAAAALAGFPVGEKKSPVTIVPTSDDLDQIRRAIAAGGTVVLMKIGKRLPEILQVLEECGVLERSVLVSRAGLPKERVETDLRRLRQSGTEAEYLAVILVQAGQAASP